MTDDPRAELAERLEPCPFCSGTADFGTRPNQKTMWSVHCDYCTAYRVGETQEEAIAAWNTRAALSQPEAGAVKDAELMDRAMAEHRQLGRREGIEEAARIADAHRQARHAAMADAKDRKQRQEARDHESMAIEAVHIATSIRALGEGK